MLTVTHLKKYFDVPAGHLHAVDDVSFSIKRGETLGVVGESGCGKSTLGRVLLGLHPATSGDIIFEGMDLSTFSKNEMIPIRREMQIIFQDPYASLNPRFTVAQIIEEPLRLHKVCKNAEERRKRVEELMEMVGLPRRAYNLYPHEFDGGRRQRIVIARALAINPQFVVCDEPVSALDVSVQAQILNLMRELQEKYQLTSLFISHDLGVVSYLSDRIGVMYLGHLVELGTTEEILKNPAHPYTKALFDVNAGVLLGEIPSPSDPPSGCPFHTRCVYCTERCKAEMPQMQTLSGEGENVHIAACHRIEVSSRKLSLSVPDLKG